MSSAGQGPGGLVGRAIGGYRLTEEIGRGATGIVFLGRRLAETPTSFERTGREEVRLPEIAAVKVLALWQLTVSERAEARPRFEREAEILQRLQHPRIVPVLSFGEDAATGAVYMILPYKAGGTLARYLAGLETPMRLEDASAFLSQIAEAVDYAHAHGVVHRDIKPGNILLDSASDQAYLADFGIVRLMSETSARLTNSGSAMGTWAYMAPEQFIDSKSATGAADIYSLGVVAYDMVAGRTPYSAMTLAEVMKAKLMDPLAPPHTLGSDLPEPIEAAIMRALERDPARRFGSAGEFAQAFALGLTGGWAPGLTSYPPPPEAPGETTSPTAVAGAPTIPVMPVTPPARRLNGRAWGVIGGVALLLLVATLVTVLSPARAAIAQYIGGSAMTYSESTATIAPTFTATAPVATATLAPTATTRPKATLPPPPPIIIIQTQPSPTTAASPVMLGPYQAVVPGHGCDSGGATWQDAGGAQITCLASAMELDHVGTVGLISELYYGNGGQFSTNYAVAVTMTSIGPRNCAGIGYGGGGGFYLAVVCGDNSVTLLRYDTGGIIGLGSGTASASSSYTLDIVLSNGHHSISVNGTQVIAVDDSSYMSTADIGLAGYTYDNSSVIADFSNFSFQPLS